MSDMDRLHDLIERLPPRQIRALPTLLDTIQPISDEEFAQRLSESPPEEVDDETSAYPGCRNRTRRERLS